MCILYTQGECMENINPNLFESLKDVVMPVLTEKPDSHFPEYLESEKVACAEALKYTKDDCERQKVIIGSQHRLQTVLITEKGCDCVVTVAKCGLAAYVVKKIIDFFKKD